MTKQYLSLFAGIGGGAFGAKAAGYQLIGAVEMDARIGDLYYQNHQSLVIYSDVKDVDPNVFPARAKDDILCIQLSPPCQPYSAANAFPDLTSDRALALDNCYHMLNYLQPEQIVIENVRAYQKSPPMDRLREWLVSNNYCYIEQIVNCADIGLPQTRIRYFLMAVKGDRKLNYLPLTHSKTDYHQLDLFGNKQPWNNWYDPIADLISDMQLTDLSDNQKLALAEYKAKNATLIESRTRSRAENGRQDRFAVRDRLDPAITVLAGNAASAQMPKLLIPTIGYHSDLPPIYTDKRPAPTVKAAMLSDGESDRKSCWRLIGNCDVREMSIRGLARLQGFPDDLILSGSKSLDCRAIGNAVPPIAMQRILENCF